jgi:hypothetical protein
VRLDGFRTSLLVAALAHAALGVVLAAVRTPRAAARGSPELLELSIEGVGWPPMVPPSRSEAPEQPASRAAARARTRTAPGEGQGRPVARGPEGSTATSPADDAVPWSFRSSAPVAVGADGYWKSVVLDGSGATRPAPAPEPLPVPRSPDRILRDGLDAHDRALGLGSAGVLVSAAHEAASPEIAPDVGSATLEIDCDAGGKVVASRVLASSGSPARWSAVARELVRLASSRTVHVPAGSRGVRTRLRIVAERAPPSGTKTTATPGAVPDDIAGGAEKACAGESAQRKCLAGMPVGVTGTFGDVANIGARLTRIVHVLVVGEETL